MMPLGLESKYGSASTIIVGGDICPVGRNMPDFARGDANCIFNDLFDEFLTADLSVVNLECPLIEQPAPILKYGPVLGAKGECVNGLKEAHIHAVGLANNHILDHGPEGLRNTIRLCHEAGIKTVGAGANLADAGRLLPLEIKNTRIGILAFAEHEFSIATKVKPGANPLDPIEFVRQMHQYRQECDCLLVLLHGGMEHYPYPSPRLQQICRFMIEEGAKAVICQHSHCPGCYEHYEGGHIVYGQGNLIFDRYPRKQGEWNRGFLVKLSIGPNMASEIDLIPYVQSDAQPGARRMNADAWPGFERDLQIRSARIKEEGFVENEWREFCSKKRYLYFSILREHNKIFRILNGMTHFTDLFNSGERAALLHNVIRCDTHREALQSILSEI